MNDVPAFPSQREHTTKEGMTLRDYFAAKAMQALLSSDEWREHMDEENAASFTAFCAYSMANQMMKEREE